MVLTIYTRMQMMNSALINRWPIRSQYDRTIVWFVQMGGVLAHGVGDHAQYAAAGRPDMFA